MYTLNVWWAVLPLECGVSGCMQGMCTAALGLHRLRADATALASLQRHDTEDVLPFLLGAGSPTRDATLGAEPAKPAAPSPGPDLASLLSSPPHGGAAAGGPGHRRTLSRGGSGLSRLISKNWNEELQVRWEPAARPGWLPGGAAPARSWLLPHCGQAA